VVFGEHRWRDTWHNLVLHDEANKLRLQSRALKNGRDENVRVQNNTNHFVDRVMDNLFLRSVRAALISLFMSLMDSLSSPSRRALFRSASTASPKSRNACWRRRRRLSALLVPPQRFTHKLAHRPVLTGGKPSGPLEHLQRQGHGYRFGSSHRFHSTKSYLIIREVYYDQPTLKKASGG
jgi:hypothetical protein